MAVVKLSRILFYVHEAVHLFGEIRELVGLDRGKGPAKTVTITPDKKEARMAIDNRGKGRNLQLSDFGPGSITVFTPSALGAGWRNVSALAAYRLQGFLKTLPYTWKVTSSWRSSTRNAAVGGAPDSKHLTGEAFDVEIYDPKFFTGESLTGYVDRARRAGFNGIGLYESKKILHVDVRSTPGSWAKIVKGGREVTTDIATFISRYATPVAIASVVTIVAAGIFLLALLSRKS